MKWTPFKSSSNSKSAMARRVQHPKALTCRRSNASRNCRKRTSISSRDPRLSRKVTSVATASSAPSLRRPTIITKVLVRHLAATKTRKAPQTMSKEVERTTCSSSELPYCVVLFLLYIKRPLKIRSICDAPF